MGLVSTSGISGVDFDVDAIGGVGADGEAVEEPVRSNQSYSDMGMVYWSTDMLTFSFDPLGSSILPVDCC